MAQATVDYSVRLQVMQSSVSNLQKVLDKLEPNSAGFNKLDKIIKAITREMEDFQVQTSKAFTSQQQFNKAEKTLEKIGDNLIRAQNTVDGLKFKDIKLTDDQVKSFDLLKEQLKKVNEEVDTVKENFKETLLGKGRNKSIIEGVDANLVTKNFDTILNRLPKAIEKANKEFYAAQQKFDLFSTKKDRASLLTTEGITKNSLGDDFFNRFFEETKSGAIRFLTRGFGKGEVKQQFLQALKNEFQLDQKDIDALVASMNGKDTFKDFNQAFLNMGADATANIFGDSWKNKLSADLAEARTKRDEAEKTLKDLQNVYSQFSAGMERDAEGRGIGEVSKAIDEQKVKVAELNRQYKELEGTYVKQVQQDQNLADSKRALNNSLTTLKDDLNSVNVAFLQAQEAQRAFSSIKTAITNFMGFTQVLNLTKKAIREAMNHIKQLDQTMSGIAIVTDMTTEDLWAQIDTYSEIAQKYGTTIQGAYEVSKIYYQAGYETNDVLTLMNETLKLSKVSGLDYAKATDYMMTA